MKTFLLNLYSDELGQDLIEYTLLIAFVALASGALFLGFGDNSLDFSVRAWTDSPDWPVVRSDIAVAISGVLREAGIEIPFPQRDLHLRSVDVELLKDLRGEATGA